MSIPTNTSYTPPTRTTHAFTSTNTTSTSTSTTTSTTQDNPTVVDGFPPVPQIKSEDSSPAQSITSHSPASGIEHKPVLPTMEKIKEEDKSPKNSTSSTNIKLAHPSKDKSPLSPFHLNLNALDNEGDDNYATPPRGPSDSSREEHYDMGNLPSYPPNISTSNTPPPRGKMKLNLGAVKPSSEEVTLNRKVNKDDNNATPPRKLSDSSREEHYDMGNLPSYPPNISTSNTPLPPGKMKLNLGTVTPSSEDVNVNRKVIKDELAQRYKINLNTDNLNIVSTDIKNILKDIDLENSQELRQQTQKLVKYSMNLNFGCKQLIYNLQNELNKMTLKGQEINENSIKGLLTLHDNLIQELKDTNSRIERLLKDTANSIIQKSGINDFKGNLLGPKTDIKPIHDALLKKLNTILQANTEKIDKKEIAKDKQTLSTNIQFLKVDLTSVSSELYQARTELSSLENNIKLHVELFNSKKAFLENSSNVKTALKFLTKWNEVKEAFFEQYATEKIELQGDSSLNETEESKIEKEKSKLINTIKNELLSNVDFLKMMEYIPNLDDLKKNSKKEKTQAEILQLANDHIQIKQPQ